MTITMSTEELEGYASKVALWHNKKVMFVLENLAPLPFEDARGQIAKLVKKYDEANPYPDWRTLL